MADTVHLEMTRESYAMFQRLALTVITDYPEGSETFDDATWLREFLDAQTDSGKAFDY